MKELVGRVHLAARSCKISVQGASELVAVGSLFLIQEERGHQLDKDPGILFLSFFNGSPSTAWEPAQSYVYNGCGRSRSRE